jgi:hypothetical protein
METCLRVKSVKAEEEEEEETVTRLFRSIEED